MRIFREISACCLLTSVAALGQAPAGSNWQRVQQLPPHAKVHVSADHKSRVCVIDSVDEDKLTCSTGRVVATSHYTFTRSEIKSIKVTRYLVSTAVGAGIGGGVGAAAGAAAFSGNGSLVHGGQAAAVLGGGFAFVGGVIGLTTDFVRGPTVYRRP
jgi:hypothetical protein